MEADETNICHASGRNVLKYLSTLDGKDKTSCGGGNIELIMGPVGKHRDCP